MDLLKINKLPKVVLLSVDVKLWIEKGKKEGGWKKVVKRTRTTNPVTKRALVLTAMPCTTAFGASLLGKSKETMLTTRTLWIEKGWNRRVSISEPSACKADALPFELQSQTQ